MIARLQKIITLGLLATELLLVIVGWHSGNLFWALCFLAGVFAAYALILAAEFAILGRINRDDPAVQPTRLQLLQAWWGEVITAVMIFCWQQPFRSQRWPDHLPHCAKGQRGVVLVHGFFCNRGLWNSWMQRLYSQGVPHVAVNLEPVFASIDAYATIVEGAVRKLEQTTGLAPVIVAHSMGGLAVRRWWIDQADPARVHRLVTLGTPHHGTWIARFALSRNSRQMRQFSTWLRALERHESPEHMKRITCFYSHCDNIVFPSSSATLAGADNRHLEAVAHVQMLSRPQPYHEVMRWLMPTR